MTESKKEKKRREKKIVKNEANTQQTFTIDHGRRNVGHKHCEQKRIHSDLGLNSTTTKVAVTIESDTTTR